MVVAGFQPVENQAGSLPPPEKLLPLTVARPPLTLPPTEPDRTARMRAAPAPRPRAWHTSHQGSGCTGGGRNMKQYVHRLSETTPTQVRPDLAGRVYEGDSMTLVRWEFAPGTPRTGMHVH